MNATPLEDAPSPPHVDKVRVDYGTWNSTIQQRKAAEDAKIRGDWSSRFYRMSLGTAIIALALGTAISMILLCWPKTVEQPVGHSLEFP